MSTALATPRETAPPSLHPRPRTEDGVPEENRILERCAREIAVEAGRGTRVVSLGGRAGRAAALLAAAIEALPGAADRSPPARRRLVFLSAARTGAMAERQLAATLGRLGAHSADDALLVVGATSPRPDSLARFARLASAAAWEHRQLWSDGAARFAVHVLSRCAASSRRTAM